MKYSNAENRVDATEPDEAVEQELPAQPVKRPAPQQSQMIEKVTTAAIKALYSKRETVAGILKMIRAAKRPEIGIARAAFAILEQIKEKMKGVDPRLANAAAPDIIAEIVRIAVAANVMKKDKGIVERAAKILMQELRRPPIHQQAPRSAAQPAQQMAQPPADEMPHEQGTSPQAGGMIANVMGG